jgi:hypothetical protein
MKKNVFERMMDPSRFHYAILDCFTESLSVGSFSARVQQGVKGFCKIEPILSRNRFHAIPLHETFEKRSILPAQLNPYLIFNRGILDPLNPWTLFSN